MTVRAMMALVAISASTLALGFEITEMISRRESYLYNAKSFARREKMERQSIALIEELSRTRTEENPSTRMREQACRLRAAYYASLKQKSQWAARRPWGSVVPDPPDPGENLMIEALKIEYSMDDMRKRIDALPDLKPFLNSDRPQR